MVNGGVTVAQLRQFIYEDLGKITLRMSIPVPYSVRIRVRIGMAIIKLGVRITGMGVEIMEV